MTHHFHRSNKKYKIASFLFDTLFFYPINIKKWRSIVVSCGRLDRISHGRICMPVICGVPAPFLVMLVIEIGSGLS